MHLKNISQLAVSLAVSHAAAPEVRAAGGPAAADADDFDGLAHLLRDAGLPDDEAACDALRADLRRELARLAHLLRG